MKRYKDAKQSFYWNDQYIIYNFRSRVLVESQFSIRRVIRALSALNSHEIKNGRQPSYMAMPVSSDQLNRVITSGNLN